MILLKNKLIFFVAIIQILFFATWYSIEKYRYIEYEPKMIKVKISPNDLEFNSDYYVVSFKFKFDDSSNFSNLKQIAKKTPMYRYIYGILKYDKNSYIPDYLSLKKTKLNPDQVAINGLYIDPKNINLLVSNSYFIGKEDYDTLKELKDKNEIGEIEVMIFVDKDSKAGVISFDVNGKKYYLR